MRFESVISRVQGSAKTLRYGVGNSLSSTHVLKQGPLSYIPNAVPGSSWPHAGGARLDPHTACSEGKPVKAGFSPHPSDKPVSQATLPHDCPINEFYSTMNKTYLP
jgi:hypothetical protein